MRAKLIPQDGGGSYRFVNMPRTSDEWRALFDGNDVEPIFLKPDLILLTPDYGTWTRNTTATEQFRVWLSMRGVQLQDGFIQGNVVVLDTPGRIREWRNRVTNEIPHPQRMSKGDKVRAAKYGLTPEQYLELIKRPCDICGDPRANCIDHDHETGKVRGHLCFRCNTGLGVYERYVKEGILGRVQAYLARENPWSLSEKRGPEAA